MTARDLEAIRKRAAAATPGPVSYDHPLHDLCVGGDHIQKEDPWYTICDENGDRLATVDTKPVAEFLTEAFTDIPALCDEVERLTKDRDALVAENAKLREVAERVKADCPPFPEIEYLYDAEEVPTGELLCGSCAQCLDEHDPDCLYALADLALRGGGG